jgi:hypothetical protein
MFTKNIFNQKDDIADLVGNILEADYKNKVEELKGDQHKIDKNKNNKIDAHDFKILRGEKTMQKEAAATPHYTDDSGNQYHYGASGYVSVKNKSGIDQGQRHLNDMSAVHKKNYEKVHGMAWNQKNEEVELEEGSTSKEKQKTPYRDIKSPEYKAAADKQKEKMKQDAATDSGKKLLNKIMSKSKNEEVELEEGSKHAARPRSASRPGTEPAKKGSLQDRMMAARARIDAKKKDMKEDVEGVAEGSEQVQIDEIKLRNIIPGLGKQIAKSRSQTKRDQARLAGIDARAAGHPEPRFTGDHPEDTPYDDVRRERDRHHKRADRYDRIAQGKSPFGKSQGVAEGSTDDGTAQRQDSIAQAAKKYLAKEEAEQVDERTLTKGETAEKERIVKGMKKSLAGFKSRYGDKAKSVMYATATKAAKKD